MKIQKRGNLLFMLKVVIYNKSNIIYFIKIKIFAIYSKMNFRSLLKQFEQAISMYRFSLKNIKWNLKKIDGYFYNFYSIIV
jgi:hypothetical protein